MNFDDMCDLVDSSKYEFLRTDKNLGQNLFYLVLSGSHGYGTNHEDSDVDFRGVAIERPNVLLGLQKFEHFEHSETDTKIWSLRRFFELCAKASPNHIEILGADASCVAISDKRAIVLRDNCDVFLSKRVYKSFGGFYREDIARILRDLDRMGANLLRKTRNDITHLVRRMIMAVGILRHGIITVNMGSNASLLLDMKLGKHDKDLLDIVSFHRSMLDEAMLTSLLPEKPNTEKIEELLLKLRGMSGYTYKKGGSNHE